MGCISWKKTVEKKDHVFWKWEVQFEHGIFSPKSQYSHRSPEASIFTKLPWGWYRRWNVLDLMPKCTRVPQNLLVSRQTTIASSWVTHMASVRIHDFGEKIAMAEIWELKKTFGFPTMFIWQTNRLSNIMVRNSVLVPQRMGTLFGNSRLWQPYTAIRWFVYSVIRRTLKIN